MQLKEIKKKTAESLKNVYTFFSKKGNLSKLLLISVIVIFIVSTLFFIFFITDLPFKLGLTDKKEKIKNSFLEKAESEFEKGYLENSAIYYLSYINTNPNKQAKIEAYRKLFQISVVQNKYYQSLDYLKKIEEIDDSIDSIYLDRLKIALRLKNLNSARNEINTHYDTMKKSTEYRELVGIYYINIGKFEKALEELLKIPFAKREFDVHKKITLCYISSDQITNCLAYLGKIESKIRSLDIKEYIADFAIMKGAALLIKGEINSALLEFSYGTNSVRYKNLSKKLTLYANILLDDTEEVAKLALDNQNVVEVDEIFLKTIGDYFYYKKRYDKALEIYINLGKMKMFDTNEISTLADLYYKTGNYQLCIDTLEKLFNEYNVKIPAIYKNISASYSALKDYQEESFHLKEGLVQYPGDVDFYVRLANFYLKRKDAGAALNYIEDGMSILKNSYDNRLDALKIAALQLTDSDMGEKELLNLREKSITNVDYYFKLIEYYIKSANYLDAQREIDTVKELSLNNEQRDSLNIYRLFVEMNNGNKIEYEKIKKELLKSQSKNLIGKFNMALLFIIDNETDKALSILTSMDINELPNDLRFKNLYLKSIVYFLKKDYSTSYKFVDNALSIDPTNNKARYLQSVIERY